MNRYHASSRIFWALSVVLLFPACSTHPQKLTMERPPEENVAPQDLSADVEWAKRAEDEVAPGFEIELRCVADPVINGKFRVEPDGKLKLPYNVEIAAAGSTLGKVSEEINKQYKKYLLAPNIRVEILKREYWVDVRGLVKKPGEYLVDSRSSLDEVIARGEGLQQNADQSAIAQYARIEQGKITRTILLRDYFAGEKSQIPEWQGGETVFFQSEKPAEEAGGTRNYVQFLGEVKRPGEYPYNSSADFYDYLIKAGGPSERADLANVALLRNSGNQREVQTFNVSQGEKLPRLAPGDTLIVNSDNPSEFEKETRIAGSFAGILSAVATVFVLVLAI